MTTIVDTTYALLDAARTDGWLRTDVRRSFSDEQLLDAEMLSNALLTETVFEAWWELPGEQLRAAVDALMQHRSPAHPPLIEGEAFRLAEILVDRRKNDYLLTLDMTLAMLNASHAAEGLSVAEIRSRLERSAEEFFSEVRPTLPAELPPGTSARRSLLTPRSIDVVPDARNGRVDLGRLLVPLVPGMTLNPSNQTGPELEQIEVVVGEDVLTLELFELEDGEDWNLFRRVNKQEFEEAGREVRERLGIFGVQLLSYVPVAGGFHRLRFIGHEEPGWCLRGIVTGPAASEPTGSDALRRLYFGTVVNLSADALRLPQDPEHLRLVHRETEGTVRIIS
ncbi:hypothetical protein ABIA35_005117 [Catenulispora sp. MAP12-49]|uniref:DUF3710 domain-containing protein n=1 Tax=unclassified Catenulispora TaxID=414885 RepID=UPI0035171DA5